MAAATQTAKRRGSSGRMLALLIFLGSVGFLVYHVPSVHSAINRKLGLESVAPAKTDLKQQNPQDAAPPAEAGTVAVQAKSKPAQETQAEIKAREEAQRKLESEAQAAQAKDEAEAQVVSMYRMMLPQKAAASLTVLDDDTAVRVLRQLPSEQAGLILAQLDPTRAAALVKRILAG